MPRYGRIRRNALNIMSDEEIVKVGIFTMIGSCSVSPEMTLTCFFEVVFRAMGLESAAGQEPTSIESSLLTSGLRIAALFTVASATPGETVFVAAVLARVARVAILVGTGAGLERVETRVTGTVFEVIVVSQAQRSGWVDYEREVST